MKNLLIEIFETKMTLERMQEMNNAISSTDSSKGSTVRQAQIISDSIRLCLSSKKFDTAESRFDLMNRLFKEMSMNLCLTKDELNYVREKVRKTRELFSTRSYINASIGFAEKSDKMKSQKGKLKYLDFAIEILKEGLDDPNSDKDKLSSDLSSLNEKMNQLQKAA